MRASHCSGFSCCRAQALGTRASVVAARGLSSCGSQALEHRLSSYGARALLLCGMWDLPGPGLEPVSPALAGGFLTTAPPGKSLTYILFLKLYLSLMRENSNNKKMNNLKMNNSVAFITFTVLFSSHLCLVPKHFHYLER